VPRTEIGDIMREILRQYHEYIALPYEGAAYVKPAHYSSYPNYAFILTPFEKRYEKQFMVHREFIYDFWIFTEIPF
jgi:hypothetical protein